eukprot:IDg7078t1
MSFFKCRVFTASILFLLVALTITSSRPARLISLTSRIDTARVCSFSCKGCKTRHRVCPKKCCKDITCPNSKDAGVSIKYTLIDPEQIFRLLNVAEI